MGYSTYSHLFLGICFTEEELFSETLTTVSFCKKEDVSKCEASSEDAFCKSCGLSKDKRKDTILAEKTLKNDIIFDLGIMSKEYFIKQREQCRWGDLEILEDYMMDNNTESEEGFEFYYRRSDDTIKTSTIFVGVTLSSGESEVSKPEEFDLNEFQVIALNLERFIKMKLGQKRTCKLHYWSEIW